MIMSEPRMTLKPTGEVWERITYLPFRNPLKVLFSSEEAVVESVKLESWKLSSFEDYEPYTSRDYKWVLRADPTIIITAVARKVYS